MNKFIDKSLSFLFSLAGRITGGLVPPPESSAPKRPKKIRFTNADKWVQGELFE